MAHGFEQIDTMFSVRQVPWHGLGRVVQDAPTAAEAIRLAGLDWEVSKYPLTCQTREIPGKFGLIREDTGDCLGVVGSWYHPVQNVEGFDFLEDLVGEELRYETAGGLFGGKRVFITTKFRKKWKVGEDEIDLYLLFSNGHTGMDSLKVAITPVRVVCNNTLQVAFRRAKSMWSMTHSDNLQRKLDEARRTLELTEIYMQNFVSMGERAMDTTVSGRLFDQLMEHLFPEPDEDSTRGRTMRNTRIHDILQCYQRRDIQPYVGTAWGVINAISDYETHVKRQNRESLAGHVLDGNMKLFQKTCEYLGMWRL